MTENARIADWGVADNSGPSKGWVVRRHGIGIAVCVRQSVSPSISYLMRRSWVVVVAGSYHQSVVTRACPATERTTGFLYVRTPKALW